MSILIWILGGVIAVLVVLLGLVFTAFYQLAGIASAVLKASWKR